MLKSIPSLETERLLLRPFSLSDLDPFTDIVANPDVMSDATYSGQTMGRSQAWNWICMMLGHWHLRGFGIWAVEERDTGKFIGRMGLQLLPFFDDVELVWMLAQDAWGKGYGAEGATAAIHFAFKTLDLPIVSAVIRVTNDQSLKLAERLGMSRDRMLEREGIDFYEYKMINPEHH